MSGLILPASCLHTVIGNLRLQSLILHSPQTFGSTTLRWLGSCQLVRLTTLPKYNHLYSSRLRESWFNHLSRPLVASQQWIFLRFSVSTRVGTSSTLDSEGEVRKERRHPSSERDASETTIWSRCLPGLLQLPWSRFFTLPGFLKIHLISRKNSLSNRQQPASIPSTSAVNQRPEQPLLLAACWYPLPPSLSPILDSTPASRCSSSPQFKATAPRTPAEACRRHWGADILKCAPTFSSVPRS